MQIKILVVLFLIVGFSQIRGQQQLSEKATVSVITCGPGDVLYTSFGHSAFRIYDPENKLDRIYNYGTFDFNAPNFYLNFAKGNLTYQLATQSFSRFLRIYKYENRWVKAQELNLTHTEIQQIFEFLENNAKPENKDYQYDFFYDNCATRIEDVIKTVLKDKVEFSNAHITETKTHRELINDYAKEFKWGKFGIDLALGSVIDDEATKDDFKFLPDYIFEGFENAIIKRNNVEFPLVIRTYNLNKTIDNNILKPLDFLLTPFVIFTFLSIIGLLICYKDFKKNRRTKSLDFLIYFISGLIGIAVVLLWFATTHTTTYKNLNLLWAFAPNLIVAFYMVKNTIPKWVLKYNYMLLSFIGIMLLIWVLKVQVFNIALLPFVLLLSIRFLLINKLSSSKK